MPVKKASRTRKTPAKTAARKAPAPRKAAKPAARKSRTRVSRAKPLKAAKPRARPARGASTARVAANAARVAAPPKAARDLAGLNRQTVTPKAAPDSRPAIAALHARVALRRPPAGDDEDDTITTHSLLLGPRNVRPYRERKGELYMGRDQLDHFRSILSTWKRDLMEEVDRTMTHMKDEAANPPDPNDRATLESEFALELRTRDRERKLIRKIDEALSRIEDGSYGYCIETGEPIGVKRLEARPVATLCIEAQERRERREKQYGDRDDWYR